MILVNQVKIPVKAKKYILDCLNSTWISGQGKYVDLFEDSFMSKLLDLPIPLKEKVFIFLRYISAPFFAIEKIIPNDAKILDIGCGHGLLELVLKHKKNNRVITGIDPDKRKIEFAKKIGKVLKKTKFLSLSALELSKEEKFDCIVIFDVDYLLGSKEKGELFKKIRTLLTKDGLLILKTVIKNKSIGYYLGYIQELFTVTLFKKTFTRNKSFHFLTIQQYKKMLKENRYQIKKDGSLKTFFYHPHYFFVAKKLI